MFPSRYFNRRYFASRYWPKEEAGGIDLSTLKTSLLSKTKYNTQVTKTKYETSVTETKYGN
jgi:hypothetical protein